MAYTSIKTTGGWSTNTVTEAYDLLFRAGLRARPLTRQFVDVRPENLTHRGGSQTIQIDNYFSRADVKAAATPLDEETDVTPTKMPATTKVTLTPDEYGFANLRTIKLANRGMVPIDPKIAEAVAYHCSDTVDLLLQTQMRGTTTKSYGGDATTTDTLAAGDLITSDLIRFGVTEMNSASVMPRGDGGGQGYVFLLHPRVARNLREETGAGGWRVPKEYVDPADIYSGEIGEYEGVRFVQSPTLSWGADDENSTSVAVYHSFLLGAEALAEDVITEPHFVLSPVTDSLKRFQGCGWYGDIDFKVFRNEAIREYQTTVS